MNERHPYDAMYFAARERSPTFRLELTVIRRMLARHGALKGRVLEVGAGSGALARSCVNRFGSWIASDWDLRHLRTTGSGGRIVALACDATRLPFAAGVLDAVVAQHVIEHFDNQVEILQGWRRALRPKGMCIVTTPNRLFPRLDWFSDATHRQLLDPTLLHSLLLEAGFTRVSVLRLVPWFGSERTVFLSARLQRVFVPLYHLIRGPSLNLLAVGYSPLFGKEGEVHLG